MAIRITLLASLIALGMSARVAIVRGDSMEPTYRDGGVVVAWRLHGSRDALRAGDVVLVRLGHDTIIKRVAYMPGDTIRSPQAIAFARVRDYFEPAGPPMPGAIEPLRVPDGTVVVLGDNRSISEDSRLFGPVPLRDVVARAIVTPEAPAPILSR